MLCKNCFQKERSHTHEKNKKIAGVAAHLRRPCFSVSRCPYCVDGAMYVIASYDETLANGKIITHYVSQCNSCGAVVTSD